MFFKILALFILDNNNIHMTKKRFGDILSCSIVGLKLLIVQIYCFFNNSF